MQRWKSLWIQGKKHKAACALLLVYLASAVALAGLLVAERKLGMANMVAKLSPFCGVWIGCLAVAALWVLLLRGFHTAGVLGQGRWWLICGGAAVLVLCAYFLLTVPGRSFIYYWDYRNYYTLQLDYEQAFAASLSDGIVYIRDGLEWEYTSFLCLFIEPFFAIGSRTGNAYVLALLPAAVLPVCLTIAALAQKLAGLWQVARPKLFVAVAMAFAVCMPLLWSTMALAQPDVLGLVFVGLVLLLTADYRFDKPEPLRLVLLFAATVAAFVARRWYLYWVVAYYLCYLIRILPGMVRGRRWRSLGLLAGFGGVSGALILLGLWPMVRTILTFDYGDRYSFYKTGGLAGELSSQLGRLGLATVVLLAAGFLCGLARKNTRALTAQAVGWAAIALVWFCSVQNMGAHHSLLLLPSAWVLGWALLARLTALPMQAAGAGCAAVALAGVLNLAGGMTGFAPLHGGLFSNQVLLAPAREDRAAIDAVCDWLTDHADDGLYMLPHSAAYNPDIFRAARLPDRTLYDALPYGSAVVGVHSFPAGLLTAKYVLTCTPFTGLDGAGTYNDAFMHWAEQGAFVPEQTFDMGNGTVFTVYRREMPLSQTELDWYKTQFSAQAQAYPELYEPVFSQAESLL